MTVGQLKAMLDMIPAETPLRIARDNFDLDVSAGLRWSGRYGQRFVELVWIDQVTHDYGDSASNESAEAVIDDGK